MKSPKPDSGKKDAPKKPWPLSWILILILLYAVAQMAWLAWGA